MATILVVEDEPSISQLLHWTLTEEGHSVDTVPDGKEALKIVQLQPFDLVICDVMLPKLRGTEVCRRLKSNPATAHICVILISAGIIVNADDPCKLDAFLAKPFDIDRMIDLVNILLARGFPRTNGGDR